MKIKVAVSRDFYVVPAKKADAYDPIDVAAAIYRQRPEMGSERAKKAADLMIDQISKNRKEGKPYNLVFFDLPDTRHDDPLYGLKIVGRPSKSIF